MKLICELNEHVEVISEESNGKKNLYIKGVFMQSVPNKNGRMYPEHTLHKEVARYMKENIKQNRAYGELGHPQGPTINLDRVSHLIESLEPQGKDIIGKAKILGTPMGKIASSLIEGGANLGVSSRGLGSLKKLSSGILEVQEDFKLVTGADIVADPSAPGAFVQGIMENTEWYYDVAKGTWAEGTVQPIVEHIKKTPKKNLREAQIRVFSHFINNLISKTKK